VLQGLVGGELIFAEVLYRDGSKQGHHYWNRLSGVAEVDLTLDQFADDEIVQAERIVTRPPGPLRRCAEQYATLSRRVQERLGLGTEPRPGRRTTKLPGDPGA
jgi:hypothetical protein